LRSSPHERELTLRQQASKSGVLAAGTLAWLLGHGG
jgi:hypothetical protein